MIVVTMCWSEVLIAAVVAAMRRIQNMKYKTKRRFSDGRHEPIWHTDAISCLGEMAVAKYLDHFWSGAIGNWEAADVSTFYQVRATDWATGRLFLHRDDKDHMPYILARVDDNKVTLVGWVYGRDGKQQDYWVELSPVAFPGRFMFVVPNELLRSMDSIPRLREAA